MKIMKVLRTFFVFTALVTLHLEGALHQQPSFIAEEVAFQSALSNNDALKVLTDLENALIETEKIKAAATLVINEVNTQRKMGAMSSVLAAKKIAQQKNIINAAEKSLKALARKSAGLVNSDSLVRSLSQYLALFQAGYFSTEEEKEFARQYIIELEQAKKSETNPAVIKKLNDEIKQQKIITGQEWSAHRKYFWGAVALIGAAGLGCVATYYAGAVPSILPVVISQDEFTGTTAGTVDFIETETETKETETEIKESVESTDTKNESVELTENKSELVEPTDTKVAIVESTKTEPEVVEFTENKPELVESTDTEKETETKESVESTDTKKELVKPTDTANVSPESGSWDWTDTFRWVVGKPSVHEEQRRQLEEQISKQNELQDENILGEAATLEQQLRQQVELQDTENKSEQVEPTDIKVAIVEPTETKTEIVEPTEIKTETVEPTETKTEAVEPTENKSEQVEPTDINVAIVEPTDTESEVVELTENKSELVESTETKIETKELVEPTETKTEAVESTDTKQETETKEIVEPTEIKTETVELKELDRLAKEQAEKLVQEKEAEEQARRIAQEEDARIAQQKKELADKELTARLEQQKIAKKRADKLEQQQKAKEREQQEQEQEAIRIAKENQDKEAEAARIAKERELAQLKSELEAKNAELAHIEQTKRLKTEEKQKLEDAFQQRRAQVSALKEEGELSALFKKELLARFDGLNTQGKKDLLEQNNVYYQLWRDALKSAEQEHNRLNTERRKEEALNMMNNAKDMGVNTVNSLWNKAKKLVSSDKQE